MKNPYSEKLQEIQTQIEQGLKRSGRAAKSVRLIGVSKKQALNKIKELHGAGLRDFGENYVQEWKKKCFDLNLPPDNSIRWHFIGALQSNKIKEVVGHVEYIHTVDREKIARKISDRAAELNICQKVLIEINLANEGNKAGFRREGFFRSIPKLAKLPNIAWEGLMAIPPQGCDKNTSRQYFEKLKSMLDECRQNGVLSGSLKELSMGMSKDYLIAIEAGATMVRIGTALFGPRK